MQVAWTARREQSVYGVFMENLAGRRRGVNEFRRSIIDGRDNEFKVAMGWRGIGGYPANIRSFQSAPRVPTVAGGEWIRL